MRVARITRWAFAIFLALPVPIASAIPVTWEFAGVVRGFDRTGAVVPDLTSRGIVAGTPISGQFSFETSTLDVDVRPDLGQYNGAILSGRVSVGAVRSNFDASGSSNFVSVQRQAALDIVSALFSVSDSAGLTVLHASLALSDRDRLLLSSDALVATPPALSELDAFVSDPTAVATKITLTFSGIRLRAELRELRAIPEPSTGALVAIGVLALALRPRSACVRRAGDESAMGAAAFV